MCNFADKKIKMRHWGDTTDEVEHSDFTAQELKKKVAVAINDRLHAPVSADCEMGVFVKKSAIFVDKDKNLLWNFSFSLGKQMEKKAKITEQFFFFFTKYMTKIKPPADGISDMWF